MTRSFVCAVKDCPSTFKCIKENPNPPISFHRFPNSTESRNLWIEFCQQDTFNTTSPYMCERHFCLSDYKIIRVPLGDTPGKRKLTSNAIPSIRPEDFTDDVSEAIQKSSCNPEDSVILLRIQALHEEMVQLQKNLQSKGEDMNNLMALYQQSRRDRPDIFKYEPDYPFDGNDEPLDTDSGEENDSGTIHIKEEQMDDEESELRKNPNLPKLQDIAKMIDEIEARNKLILDTSVDINLMLPEKSLKGPRSSYATKIQNIGRGQTATGIKMEMVVVECDPMDQSHNDIHSPELTLPSEDLGKRTVKRQKYLEDSDDDPFDGENSDGSPKSTKSTKLKKNKTSKSPKTTKLKKSPRKVKKEEMEEDEEDDLEEDDIDQKPLLSSDGKIYECKQCTKIFQDRDLFEKHVKRHRYDPPKKCDQCDLEFQTPFRYEQHLKQHQSKEKICHLCGKICTNNRTFKRHMLFHNPKKWYKCDFEDCPKSFKQINHLKNHINTHTGARPHLCSDCGIGFTQSYALSLHMKKHREEFHECDKCSAKYVSLRELRLHVIKCDGSKSSRGRAGVRKAGKNRIMDKIYRCTVAACEARFAFKVSIHSHMKNVHNLELSELTCVFCGIEFEDAGILRSHVRDHTNIYECDICKVKFKLHEKLLKHMETSHGDGDVRPFICVECGAAFKRAEHLRSHMSFKHSDERKFKCDFPGCDYAAKLKFDLNAHVKMHLMPGSEKHLKCRLCEYVTIRSTSLRVHMQKMHNTEDIYSCDDCGSCYKYITDFMMHKKEPCINHVSQAPTIDIDSN